MADYPILEFGDFRYLIRESPFPESGIPHFLSEIIQFPNRG